MPVLFQSVYVSLATVMCEHQAVCVSANILHHLTLILSSLAVCMSASYSLPSHLSLASFSSNLPSAVSEGAKAYVRVGNFIQSGNNIAVSISCLNNTVNLTSSLQYPMMSNFTSVPLPSNNGPGLVLFS